MATLDHPGNLQIVIEVNKKADELTFLPVYRKKSVDRTYVGENGGEARLLYAAF